jgi:hemerythrin-like domain-containing protein
MEESAMVTPAREPELLFTLRSEHRHIRSVLDLLSHQFDRIARGAPVDTRLIQETVDYMVVWPDRFHHPREDRIYDYLADLDPQAGPDMAGLQHDHERLAASGRALLESIADWRAGELSGERLLLRGRAYIDESRQHMAIEETEVFPLLQAALDAADWRELRRLDALQVASDPVFGRRVQREFRHLTRRIRRGVEHGAVSEWVGIDAALESLEVLSIAWQNTRVSTLDHLNCAYRESLYELLTDPLRAPLRRAVGNSRLGVNWLRDLSQTWRDTARDLQRVERDRRDRQGMLSRLRAAGGRSQTSP